MRRVRHSSYSLKRIARPSDPHFAQAIAIYVQTVSPTLQTDTNEISFWLSEYAKRFSDEFLVFSFSVRENVVGYAQMVYFRTEKLMTIDYLVITPAYRQNNVFFEFVQQIRDYVREQNWPVRWATAEVTLTHQPRPDADAALLIRLLKMERFKVVRAPYYQPLLDLTNIESECPAVLLLAGDPRLQRIKKDTYLSIVNTLYHQHYIRWYSIYPPRQSSERLRRTMALESRIEREIRQAKWIGLNGNALTLQSLGSEETVTSAAETNLATNAVRAAIVLVVALAGGTLPEPFRLAVWIVLGLGVFVAVLVWPRPRWRRLLWKEIKFSRTRE